jgi:hypothetical protein
MIVRMWPRAADLGVAESRQLSWIHRLNANILRDAAPSTLGPRHIDPFFQTLALYGFV